MEEKQTEKESEQRNWRRQPIVDVIITPLNYAKAFKRLGHCLKEKGFATIGVTSKNLSLYNDVMRDLKAFDIKVEEKRRIPYDAKGHEAISIEIHVCF